MSKNNTIDAGNGYIPSPIDLDHIELPAQLEPLVQQLAEQVHEVWALQRVRQGWRYGEQRNDALKLHPDLKPFSNLTAQEAEYDVATAVTTIKQLLALGYRIEITFYLSVCPLLESNSSYNNKSKQ